MPFCKTRGLFIDIFPYNPIVDWLLIRTRVKAPPLKIHTYVTRERESMISANEKVYRNLDQYISNNKYGNGGRKKSTKQPRTMQEIQEILNKKVRKTTGGSRDRSTT